MATNLTLTSPVYGTGKFGQGLTGGYGSATPTGLNARPYTIEFFASVSTVSAIQVAVGAAPWIGVTAAGLPSAQGSGGGNITGTARVDDGAIHHWKYVATTTGQALYIDGTLVASNNGLATSFPSSGVMGVRRYGATAGYDWSGMVDSIAIWPTDRSAAPVPTSAYVGNEGMAVLWNLDGNGTDSYGNAPTAATTYTLTGPSSGTSGTASSAFTVTASGALSAAVTVTPNDSTGGGSFSPTSVTLAAGTNTSATFTYTPSSAGAKTITTTNNGGLTDPAPITYTASAAAAAATAYTLTGPTTGTVGSASSAFTAQSNGTLSSAVTITPADSGGGGSFSPATITLAAGANTFATLTYTAASAGAKTISATNNGSLTNPGSLTYTAAAATALFQNVYFSPSNWSITANRAETIAPGAYFKTAFTGASATLNFDVSAVAGPNPQIWYSIDGNPKIQATLAATIALTMPSDTTPWSTHSLEVWVKSTASTNRWGTKATTVALTGITLASGGTLSAPTVRSKTMWVYGDSLSEGVATRNGTAAAIDQNDAMLSWAFLLGQQLGAEVGVIGYGGVGVTIAGDGGVPAWPSSFNQIMSGVTRSFSPEPDLIVLNLGTNDAIKTSNTTTVTSGLVSGINSLLASTTNTRIVVLQTFNNNLTSYIQAAVTQVANPRCTYLSTSGFFDTALSADGVHPYGIANIRTIAPSVANGLRPVLYPSTGGTNTTTVVTVVLPQFRAGFH